MMWSPLAPNSWSPSGRARRGRSPLRSLPQIPQASIFRMAASSGMSSGRRNSRTSNSPGPVFTEAKLVSGMDCILLAHHELGLHRLEPGCLLRKHRLVGPQAVVRRAQSGWVAALLDGLDGVQQLAARLDDREVRR